MILFLFIYFFQTKQSKIPFYFHFFFFVYFFSIFIYFICFIEAKQNLWLVCSISLLKCVIFISQKSSRFLCCGIVKYVNSKKCFPIFPISLNQSLYFLFIIGVSLFFQNSLFEFPGKKLDVDD